MSPLLELRDVTKTFAGGVLGREHKVALERVTFAIDPAQPGITAVVGESGSGKTTLARLLLGLIEPSEGEVRYQGRPMHSLSARGAARVPPRGAGDLPGPVRGLQPVLPCRSRADDAGARSSASPRRAPRRGG